MIRVLSYIYVIHIVWYIYMIRVLSYIYVIHVV
jgi:hypothetical protein